MSLLKQEKPKNKINRKLVFFIIFIIFTFSLLGGMYFLRQQELKSAQLNFTIAFIPPNATTIALLHTDVTHNKKDDYIAIYDVVTEGKTERFLAIYMSNAYGYLIKKIKKIGIVNVKEDFESDTEPFTSVYFEDNYLQFNYKYGSNYLWNMSVNFIYLNENWYLSHVNLVGSNMLGDNKEYISINANSEFNQIKMIDFDIKEIFSMIEKKRNNKSVPS